MAMAKRWLETRLFHKFLLHPIFQTAFRVVGQQIEWITIYKDGGDNLYADISQQCFIESKKQTAFGAGEKRA